MQPWYAKVLLVLATLGSACTQVAPVKIQANEILALTLLSGNGQPEIWSLSPSAKEHQEFRNWLTANQTGWSPYLDTTPGTGLLVDFQDGRVQLLVGSVLACSKGKACVYKSVPPNTFKYLLQSKGAAGAA
jgi:hypothetical protein